MFSLWGGFILAFGGCGCCNWLFITCRFGVVEIDLLSVVLVGLFRLPVSWLFLV